MKDDSSLLGKLHPASFRDAAARGMGEGKIQVIVQLRTSGPSIELGPDAVQDGFAARPTRIISAPDNGAPSVLRGTIEAIAEGKAIAPYGTTTTFVVDASFDEIMKIAALDGVKEIWPNDLHADFSSA